MKVIDPISYTGAGHKVLINFFWQCEELFNIWSPQYVNDRAKVQLDKMFLKEEPKDAWYHRCKAAGEASESSWKKFKEFLEEQLDPTSLHVINVPQKYFNAWQGPNQRIFRFFNYLIKLEAQMKSYTE